MGVKQVVVYLVGAGPGDPELLTLKAHRLLKDADAVVYDRLVHPDFLALVKPGCKKYYVGKKPGHHYKTQDEINNLLISLGRTYENVVRLKGGDPFLFGRGGEEAEELTKNNIGFEIVPGVSSVYSVPAYAGIPITHRDFNSGFAVYTGQTASMESGVNLDKAPPVIVILMGSGNRDMISEHLLNSERFSSETPVAIISWGTYLRQKVVVTTIAEMSSLNVETPAIIVVGEVVSLRSKLNWFDKRLQNLKGKKILIPRSKKSDDCTGEIIRTLGAEPVFCPLLDLKEIPFDVPNPDHYDAYVFTSKNGVKIFTSHTNLEPTKMYFAIGPTTQKELEKLGIDATCGSEYNSVALGRTILETLPKGARVILIRSSNATADLRNMLKNKYEVTELSVYQVSSMSIDKETLSNADVVLITAGTVAKPFAPYLKCIKERGIIMTSIGPVTSRTMREINMEPTVEASNHTIEGMLYSLIDYLNHKEKRIVRQDNR